MIAFPFDRRKADDMIDYILWKEPGVEPVKLAIMLYYIDRESFRRHNQPIIGGTYIATEAGPVIKEACENWLRLDSPWLPHARMPSWKRGIWA